MFVLGIDPGLSRCGYGCVTRVSGRYTPVAGGYVTTSPGQPLHERLSTLHSELGELIEELAPAAVVVEKVFFQNNARTAMPVGQASGVALLAAAQAGCEVAEYTSNEVKLAVAGYGGAGKDQVQRMVARLLGLDDVPRPPDAADALALALCHLATAGWRAATAAADAGAGGDREDSARGDDLMIGSLSGKVGEYVSIGDTVAEIVVDVAGVGYLVSVTTATASSTDGVGADVRLAVHTHVRDGAITLYGFATPAERHAFELLLGAQGVGPALALAILGVHGPEDLAEIVANDDLASLTHVPGVGRKTAERLLVELRSRVADLTAAAGRSALSASRSQPPGGAERGELAEVRAALAALGYSPEEVRAALSEIPTEGSVEELLRAALRGLAPRR